MKNLSFYAMFLVTVLMAGCGKRLFVEVRNPLDIDRHPEMVELQLSEVCDRLGLAEGGPFVVKEDTGEEVPYQVTSDGLVVFQVQMRAGETKRFVLTEGCPADVARRVFAKQYARKDNDFAWENDLVGFRAYGNSSPSPSGYDIFTKRGIYPVLDTLYANETDPECWRIHAELAKTDPVAAHRYLYDVISYHVDHGYGMDCYGVGPTLGAGVAALVHEDQIQYPCCYDSYEILDDGPLRLRFKFVFRPVSIGEDEVVETRVFTLDAGTRLNRTAVSYEGLNSSKEIVAGIVLQDKDGNHVADAAKGIISYPAPTINADNTVEVDNGVIYVGHVYPSSLKDARAVYFSDQESRQRNGTKGHVLAFSDYVPESEFVYFWGFGWSKDVMAFHEDWVRYLETAASQVKCPLETSFY